MIIFSVTNFCTQKDKKVRHTHQTHKQQHTPAVAVWSFWLQKCRRHFRSQKCLTSLNIASFCLSFPARPQVSHLASWETRRETSNSWFHHLITCLLWLIIYRKGRLAAWTLNVSEWAAVIVLWPNFHLYLHGRRAFCILSCSLQSRILFLCLYTLLTPTSLRWRNNTHRSDSVRPTSPPGRGKRASCSLGGKRAEGERFIGFSYCINLLSLCFSLSFSSFLSCPSLKESIDLSLSSALWCSRPIGV